MEDKRMTQVATVRLDAPVAEIVKAKADELQALAGIGTRSNAIRAIILEWAKIKAIKQAAK